uniref:Uncharacterized protein n=1 Tax=Triticum urartu TaxID=4572 RepID=A0A8R7V1J6_TRIUA
MWWMIHYQPQKQLQIRCWLQGWIRQFILMMKNLTIRLRIVALLVQVLLMTKAIH